MLFAPGAGDNKREEGHTREASSRSLPVATGQANQRVRFELVTSGAMSKEGGKRPLPTPSPLRRMEDPSLDHIMPSRKGRRYVEQERPTPGHGTMR